MKENEKVLKSHENFLGFLAHVFHGKKIYGFKTKETTNFGFDVTPNSGAYFP